MPIQYIQPDTMPVPKGHYTPGIIHHGIVYVAGQLPFDHQGQLQLGSIEEQTTLCMQNMEQILLAAGSNLHHVLKVNIYVSDLELWPRINAAYAQIMGDHKPARAIIPCNTLHYGSLIEIDCIAAVIDQ